MDTPTVFISYSHDSQEHEMRVLELSNCLRGHGIDVELDQYNTQPAQGWPRWCAERLKPENARFILVIFTRIYLERVENQVQADEGKGVYWEGSILFNYLYNEKGTNRFLFVLFDDTKDDVIPVPLNGYNRYRIRDFKFTDLGYEDLYRTLTNQPPESKPELGEIVILEKASAVSTKETASGELLELAESQPTQEVKTHFTVNTEFCTFNLPVRPPTLIGRLAELEKIIEHLKSYRSVYIYGTPGVGKTTLASEAVWRVQNHFRGQIIFDFALNRKPDDILKLIADAFSSASKVVGLNLTQKERVIEGLLRKNHPVLVFLDNVEATGLVSKLANLSGCCTFLITSREFSALDWFRIKELKMLEHSAAIELFKKSFGGNLPIETDADIDRICSILGNMPLAIDLCARRAKKDRIPFDTLIQLLSRDTLAVVDFPDRSVEKIINFSYERLEDDNKIFFAMLSLFGGRTFSIDAVEKIWKSADATAQWMHLRDLSLLETAGGGRLVLHPLIHEFAVRAHQNLAISSHFLDRLISYYKEYASENREHFCKIDIEVENIFGAMEECDKSHRKSDYLDFADALLKMYQDSHYVYGYLPQKGFWDDAMQIILRSLRLTSDPLKMAKLYEHRGLIFYWMGENEKAKESYQQAMTLFRKQGDYYGEALILHRRGFIESDEGLYQNCEDSYRLSIKIAEEHGLPLDIVATGIHLLGVILYHRCRYEESKLNLEKAMEMRARINSVAHSVTARRLAATYRRMGSVPQSRALLEKFLEVDRKSGNERNLARCLRQFGMVNLDSDDYCGARENFEESYKIFQKIGNKKGIASVLTNLGELNIREQRIAEAEAQIRESLTMAKDLKSQYGIAINLRWIAEINYHQKQYKKAAENALEAINYFESLEHVHVETVCRVLNKSLLGLSLQKTCRLSLPRLFDGQCSKRAEAKFKELMTGALSRLAENNPHIDGHLLDLPQDKRRGISLIIRPAKEVNDLLKRVSDHLHEQAPNHHYYVPDEYHVTVMSLIVADGQLNLNDARIEQYTQNISDALSGQHAFRLRFRGIGVTESGVIAYGYYQDGTLYKIRQQIKKALLENDVEVHSDDRYEPISAHITFLRFRSNENLKSMIKEIDHSKSCDLGLCPVNRLDLVENDWFMSQDKVKKIASFELQ